MIAHYTDSELVRMLKHGVKKDGRSLKFMPVQDFSWLPDSDLIAIVSYLRTVAPIAKPSETSSVGALGKMTRPSRDVHRGCRAKGLRDSR